jgi:hypothetical protein
MIVMLVMLDLLGQVNKIGSTVICVEEEFCNGVDLAANLIST